MCCCKDLHGGGVGLARISRYRPLWWPEVIYLLNQNITRYVDGSREPCSIATMPVQTTKGIYISDAFEEPLPGCIAQHSRKQST